MARALLYLSLLMSDFLELQLRPGDDAAHDWLRDIVNLQAAEDRMSRWRQRWTALVAVASVPLLWIALRRAPDLPIPTWLLAIWATSLLAATASGVAQWSFRRRLGALLAQAEGYATRRVS